MPRLITKVFAQILALAGLAVFVGPVSAQGQPEPTARWEYRVLTKSDVLDLGNKDLAAGLNKIYTFSGKKWNNKDNFFRQA